ncbi:MAG: 3-hydroxybutyryl-CoA dehydrogenase, partial [Deltaproteobacteria bacterium]|nr:3-hydroxybutyryl-CoA dehydrogenase [Deltaproteobacteria bacterium]
DVSPEIISRGMDRIEESLERLVQSHRKTSGKTGLSTAEMKKIRDRLKTSTDLGKLSDRDIAIEAMVEDEEAKKSMIGRLVKAGYDGILTSNTSSISITRLASAYPWPERFMGMHFMNPVPVQPGCELIRGLLTSDETSEKVA